VVLEQSDVDDSDADSQDSNAEGFFAHDYPGEAGCTARWRCSPCMACARFDDSRKAQASAAAAVLQATSHAAMQPCFANHSPQRLPLLLPLQTRSRTTAALTTTGTTQRAFPLVSGAPPPAGTLPAMAAATHTDPAPLSWQQFLAPAACSLIAV
jgi:hypothetical protein